MTKKELIQNHLEFLSSMFDYENKKDNIVNDVLLYFSNNNRKVSKSYIYKIKREFIF